MNHQSLQGYVALVTGASRGIGAAIAMTLAQQGAYVIGTATTDTGAASITEHLSVIQEGGHGVVLNVNHATDVLGLIENIVKEQGGLSMLVNNAGILQDQLAIRMTEKSWDDVVATNLTAVSRLSRTVLPTMIKARFGRIINITSVAASIGIAGQINYAAAKAGVEGMSRALAQEVGSRHITVNCIAPGFIETDMTKSLSNERKAAMFAHIPVGRFGTPQDIATAVAFLASPQASYITGTVLHVNGGMYMNS